MWVRWRAPARLDGTRGHQGPQGPAFHPQGAEDLWTSRAQPEADVQGGGGNVPAAHSLKGRPPGWPCSATVPAKVGTWPMESVPNLVVLEQGQVGPGCPMLSAPTTQSSRGKKTLTLETSDNPQHLLCSAFPCSALSAHPHPRPPSSFPALPSPRSLPPQHLASKFTFLGSHSPLSWCRKKKEEGPLISTYWAAIHRVPLKEDAAVGHRQPNMLTACPTAALKLRPPKPPKISQPSPCACVPKTRLPVTGHRPMPRNVNCHKVTGTTPTGSHD